MEEILDRRAERMAAVETEIAERRAAAAADIEAYINAMPTAMQPNVRARATAMPPTYYADGNYYIGFARYIWGTSTRLCYTWKVATARAERWSVQSKMRFERVSRLSSNPGSAISGIPASDA